MSKQGLHIVVMGLMGVGKTTTARALARELNLPVHDSDTDIGRLFGRSGAELAEGVDVAALHRAEAAVLLGRLADEAPLVIAAAASVVEDELVRTALARRATVVFLRAPLAEIERRIATGDHRRSITSDDLAAIATRRGPLFAQVTDLDLDATSTTEELVATALHHLENSHG